MTGLLVQGRGELALAWDRVGSERAMAAAIETLKQLRPAAKGAVKAVHYHSARGLEAALESSECVAIEVLSA